MLRRMITVEIIPFGALVGWTTLLAFFFAKVEIQIEGADGWAAKLPTWRIERHWLLDLFWGGRPMTGYHFWVFSFIFLFSHLGLFLTGTWSWRLELRVLGMISAFWTIEDFLWFFMNPAYGLRNFRSGRIAWHKRWWLGMPTDYWYLGVPGLLLMFGTYADLI